MKQLDLFAGIGGISLAAEWSGIETVAFCEKEPFAQGVLRRRFPGRPIYDDVFNLTREVLERDGITGIDIVAGGFPCQPFSNAGKRTGTADDRYLWPEMCRIIRELRPSWVFAENVDGLVSMAQSDWEFVMEDETTICEEAEMVVETIRKDLKDLGYQSIPVVIPACGVGASHRRYRIFILGFTTSSGLSQRGCSGFTTCEEEAAAGMESEPKRSSEALAHTEGKRRGETRRDCERSEKRASGSGLVGDSPIIGLQGGGPEREQVATEYGAKRLSLSPSGNGEVRTAQPGMGGSPYELSDWLDGFGMNPLDALINFISSYPQPALMGQAQHTWEPPRVATGIKNRSARLKSLGNAVDPLQALPVLYGIRIIHESLQKEAKPNA